MQLHTATVSGRTVSFGAGGDPEAPRTLILVHAFPVGVRMWAPQLDAFPGWRVLAPALPGFDGSDAAPEPSVDAYAAQVADFAAQQGVREAVFAGVSMGGYVLFALVRRSAALVSGLILADTRAGADTEQARAGRRQMIETARANGASAVAEAVIPKLLGPSTTARRPDLAAHVRQMIESQTPDAIAAALQALMHRPDATATATAVQVPTAILVGDEDVLTPPAEAERLQSLVRGSHLTRITNAGHLTSLEDPDAFNVAAWSFLEQHFPSGAASIVPSARD